MKKRGISAVVATILMILIVVVGVGIVWKVILPLFVELEFMSYSDVQLKVVFQGHTVYDADKNFAFVQVERGKDDVNVTGVEIGFDFEGTTKTYQSKSVPSPSGTYTYKFNFTNDTDMGIPKGVAPSKVTVAPIFKIKDKVRLGKVLDSKEMPVGRIRLSALEWAKANNESATVIVVTTGDGNGDEPGVQVDPVEPEIEEEPEDPITTNIIYIDSCRELNQSGKYYILNKSLSVSGTCFVIAADNIILDGNQHSISGDLSQGYGVNVHWQDNVTIKNFGEIKEFYYGITLNNNFNNNVMNNTLNSNYFGIDVSVSSQNIIQDNVVTDSTKQGIRLLTGSNDNLVIRNTANDNGNDGIYVHTSYDNILRENIANDNGAKGIQLYESFNNLVESNELRRNKVNGCLQIRKGGNNTIVENIMDNCETYGVWVWDSPDNVFENNLIKNIRTGYSSFARGIFIRNYAAKNNKIYCDRYENNKVDVVDWGLNNIYYGPVGPTGLSASRRQDYDCSSYCEWVGEECV